MLVFRNMSFIGVRGPLQLYAWLYVWVCVRICEIIYFKCVGSLSYASLGVAPGFPAPPGHLRVLVPVTGYRPSWSVCFAACTGLCLCVSAEDPARSKHHCLILFEPRGLIRKHTQTLRLYIWFRPPSSSPVDSSFLGKNQKNIINKKKTKGIKKCWQRGEKVEGGSFK